MANVMLAKDALTASQAECYATINGVRYNLMNAINIEVTMERTKTEVPILGRLAKGNKAVGWKGTGSCTMHFNTSVFRKAMKAFKDNGQDVYFDMQITNYDPTSAVGRQTIVLRDCNPDNVILAKFDADGEYLDEDMDFTFEDWDMPEEFEELMGIR